MDPSNLFGSSLTIWFLVILSKVLGAMWQNRSWIICKLSFDEVEEMATFDGTMIEMGRLYRVLYLVWFFWPTMNLWSLSKNSITSPCVIVRMCFGIAPNETKLNDAPGTKLTLFKVMFCHLLSTHTCALTVPIDSAPNSVPGWFPPAYFSSGRRFWWFFWRHRRYHFLSFIQWNSERVVWWR